MFTGLVQASGMLHSVGDDQLRITCSPNAVDAILQDLAIGDSVSVDGVCLTVVEILPTGFNAVASSETLDRSTLGQLETRYVNLETSLRVGSKLGGHFVTGHVDGIGCLQASIQTASAWEMTFTVKDPQIARYIIPKGSIAVNGVSLTVADCDSTGSWFMVAVIPHTYSETNLQYLRPGYWVNLEGDILGKYVEKFLRFGAAPANGSSLEALPDAMQITSPWSALGSVTPDFLAEHGYL